MQIISLYNLSLHEVKQELYYVIESMEIDLDKIINKSEQILTEPHIKCLMKQLLEGLKAIHSLGVNHRDIKPANLLVNQDCQLRITDFGLARFVGKVDYEHINESVTPMTEYVVTRWYRAPEILLAPGAAYSEAIDIWSAGCVCAEMFLRKPLFPGEGYIDQVQLIFKVIGLKDVDDLGFGVSDSVANFLNYRCLSQGESYESLFPGTSDEALQFLEAMLTVNPLSRPSASLALSFPFISDADVLFDYKQFEILPPPSDYFSYEYSNLDAIELAQLIRQDVQRFNNDTSHCSSEAETSEHSITSIDSNETFEEGYSIESPTLIDERNVQPTVYDSSETQQLRKVKESCSLSNPFGKHNSNAKRHDRQNSFPQTPPVDSSFTADSTTLRNGEFEIDEGTKTKGFMSEETTNTAYESVGAVVLLQPSPRELSVMTAAVSEIAPTNMNRQVDNRIMHSKRIDPRTKHLGESTALKPIDKQSKFSQSRGFPFAGLSKSSLITASNRPAGSRLDSAKLGRATISVFSDVFTAPLRIPPILLSNSVSLAILGEEGSVMIKQRAKETTTTKGTTLRDRHRTQRFSIVDIDIDQKYALSDLLLQRPSRNRMSSIQGVKFARSNSQT